MGKSVPRHVTPSVVVLWGDQHQDDAEMCPSCLCDSEEKNCCYTIYDKEFLKGWDQIAAEYPVDFFTEYSTGHLEGQEKNVLFRRFLHDTVRHCHKKGLRSKVEYTTDCPTTHIRWHYSDPRFEKNLVEHYIFQHIHGAMSNLFQANGLIDILWTHSNPQLIMEDILKELRPAVHRYRMDNDPAHADAINHALHLCREFIVILLSDLPVEKRIYGVFLLYYINLYDRDYSIMKQYRKIQVGTSISPEEFAEFISRHFMNKYIYTLGRINDDVITRVNSAIRQALTKLIIDPDEDMSLIRSLSRDQILDISDIIGTLGKYFFCMSSVFVDLHTIFRMCKPPKDNALGFLALGYFGHAHVENIVDMLADGFGYQLKPSNTASSLRCIHITAPLHPLSDLEITKHQFGSEEAYRHALQTYQTVLKNERWRRGANELGKIENPFEGGRKTRRHAKQTRQQGRRVKTRRRKTSTRTSSRIK